MTSQPTDTKDAIDRYKVLRAQVEHEDTLIGTRLGWLIGSESFLFAAYATALTVSSAPGEARFVPLADRLVTVVAILGLVLSMLVWLSLFAASRAIRNLQRDCPVVPGLPSVVGESQMHYLGLVPPLTIPFAILIAWVALLVTSPGR